MAILGDRAIEARVDAELEPLAGFAQFDDPNAATTGRAFLPEGEIKRFDSAEDIEGSVLWVTNLGPEDEPLLRRRNLRCSGFLSVTVQDIAQDLGLAVLGDGRLSDRAGAYVAAIIDRTLRAAASAYGAESAFRWTHALKGKYLFQALAKTLPRGPLGTVEAFPRQRDILASAYQARAVPQWDGWHLGPDTRFVTMRFNRLAYARQLLQMHVPVGRTWTYVEGLAGADVLSEMLARPCLVRAEVATRQSATDVSPVTLAAIGMDGKSPARRRGWFSQPELASVSEYMEVHPSGFLVDEDGLCPLPVRAALPTALTDRAERALSFAFGLVAYCHWMALATPRQPADRDIDQPDLWSVWLRAMDRSLMHEVALRAHRDGLHVEAYGEGSIVLRLQEDQLPIAQRFWNLERFDFPCNGILAAS
ncbi:hypothetical protein [Achromobacter xylosoxidans]|uniref:hypothetical protein n=1 Tax=Alcaligenes xylosoxydans xylosoxydans TaxID=85698 RepID=UPI001F290C1C|nr:hypothetical protein [Achromobacter xylosoxidans]